MGIVKQTVKEATGLIVIAFVLGFVANEMKGDARIEPWRNYFAKRVRPVDEAAVTSSDAGADAVSSSDADIAFQQISFDDLADAFTAGETEGGAWVIVDARSDEPFSEGHIPGALQCDHFQLERFINNIIEEVAAADRVVVYCTGGDCEDSILVCGDLEEFDVPFDKIYLFKGGWEKWTQNNMPTAGRGVN